MMRATGATGLAPRLNNSFKYRVYPVFFSVHLDFFPAQGAYELKWVSFMDSWNVREDPFFCQL